MTAGVANEYVSLQLTTGTPSVTVTNPVASGDVLVLVEMGAFGSSAEHCTSFSGLGGTWTKRGALTGTPFDVWVGTGCTGTGAVTGAGGTALGSVNRRRLVVWHLEDVSTTIVEDLESGSGTITTAALDGELGQVVLALGYTANPPANAVSAYAPASGWSQPANTGTGAYNLTSDNVRYGKPVYRVPAGAAESHTISSVRASGTAYAFVMVVGDPVVPAPDAPTSVVGSAGSSTATLTWSAPAGGGPVTSYDVRLDGGADTPAASPHTFTGLDPLTGYDLEVRAVGPGGVSAWVLVTVETLEAVPPGFYQVTLTVGPYTWTVDRWDCAEDGYGIRLPLSLGWAIGESVEFFPSAPDPATLTFGVLVGDASELVDLVRGATVTFRMHTDPDGPPWQRLDGVVTQVDGRVTDAGDYLVTVYAAETTMVLDSHVVGWTVDWPIEHIGDRLDRIMAETGLGTVETWALGTGLEGWLAARNAGPTTALAAIRTALKDAADEYDSEPPDVYYGRHVFTLDTDGNLNIAAWRRRVYDTHVLDGCYVHANGSWVRPPVDTGTWVLVDGVTFGTPSGPPIWRSTSLLDYFGDPPGSETNYSANTRDNLGNSLLPDGSTQLDGWFARVLRYDAHLDPDPVTMWASPQFIVDPLEGANLPVVRPVVVTPVAENLDLNDVGYLAGTLTGARLTIPAGGDYYVDLSLRPELLPGTDLPA